jgi:hypothetical protein
MAEELLALALEDVRAFFFLPTATAFLSSRRRGEGSRLESMSPYIFFLWCGKSLAIINLILKAYINA